MEGGEVDTIKIYEERLSKKTKIILKEIEEFKQKEKENFEKEVKFLLDREFNLAYLNVDKFADWFFAYTTQYKILYQGAVGIIDKYRMGLNNFSLTKSATYKITNYLASHYRAIVLKPHLLEPHLTLNLKKLLLKYTKRKTKFMQKIDIDFKEFLDKTRVTLSKMRAKNPYIDWKSNIENIKGLIALKNKDAESGIFTIGGTTIISAKIGSKVVTSTASKAVAGKIVATTGLKKMIASLVAKLAGGVSTLGVGLVIGGVIDYSLNEADELANRDSFIKDVNQSIDNIKNSILFEITKQNLIEKLYNRDINSYKKFIIK